MSQPPPIEEDFYIMPSSYKATWEKDRYRWLKMLNGTRYRITCEQLGLPKAQWTKEKSYQAALTHFESVKNTQQEKSDKDKELVGKIRRQHMLAQIMEDVNIWHDSDEKILEKVNERLGNQADDKYSIYGLAPNTTQEKRLDNLIKQALPLFTQGNSIATFDQYRKEMQHIQDTFKADFDVSTFSETHITQYYATVQNLPLIERGKAKQWAMFKRLIKYLAEENILKRLPSNIDSKLLWFSRVFDKQILEYDNKEVIDYIDRLGEQSDFWKLIVLLHLNCGLQTADIAELKQTITYNEGKQVFRTPVGVDWENRRIVRIRVKNKKTNNPPITSYPLWVTTFRLLEKYRELNSEYVLLTATGKQWKRGRTNDMVEAYGDLKIEDKIPLKNFRSIGGTALGLKYDAYKDHYLCNTSDGIKNKHYDAKQQKEFDKAINFLGKTFQQM